MGFLDDAKEKFNDAKDKLADLVDGKEETVGEQVDKAADVADDKTGGQYTEHIDTGADKIKDGVDSLDGKNDDIP